MSLNLKCNFPFQKYFYKNHNILYRKYNSTICSPLNSGAEDSYVFIKKEKKES